ncbi:MAG: 30S ribosome-binding factor RbfA [Candidatus Methylomirabilales bacterium]
MMTEYARARRVGDLLKEELADLILREVKDPRVGFLTLTAVEVSKDLKHARVFFVTHEVEAAERTRSGLQSASGYLRGALGRRLHLRHVPDLLFLFDTSLDHGMRINALLKELAQDGEGHES